MKAFPIILMIYIHIRIHIIADSSSFSPKLTPKFWLTLPYFQVLLRRRISFFLIRAFFFLKKKGRKRSLRRNRYKVLEKCESGGGGTCEHTCQRFSTSASASFMSVSASGTSMSEVFSQRRNCKIGWWVSGFSAAEPDYFRSFVVVELTIMFIWEENLANFYCFLGIEYHCKIILWKTRSTQTSIWQFDPNETVSFSYLTDVWWTCNITPKEILESLFFMLHSPTFTEWRDAHFIWGFLGTY